MNDNTGFGFNQIARSYSFDYVPNVDTLIKDIKLLADINKKNGIESFQKTYVVDGLSQKKGGHSYAVNVMYMDGKCYAAVFDSVANLYPAFIDEIGDTFEKVSLNADVFQHSWIGCRGHALDVFKILESEIENASKEKEGEEKYSYYYDYIVPTCCEGNKTDINEYRKDLFDYIVKEQKNIVYLNKILKSKKNDIEDKINTIFQTKEEIQFLENKIIELKTGLEKYVKDEIKKPDFDITQFITNRKGDVKKFTPQQIIDCKWYDSKNITRFDVYHPQMTHLMEDYKILRKHILYYKDNLEAMLIIKSEIERGITYDCFKVKDSNIGKDPKTGQKFESKADDVIAQIINNPNSTYCFSGYKRRELNHIFGSISKTLNSFVSRLTGYNKESHQIKQLPSNYR
jgi:hypothetical protein